MPNLLSTEIEQAGAERQRELLAEAWRVLKVRWDGDVPDGAEQFKAMLDAGAFESAAMILAPEGWWIEVHRFPGDGSGLGVLKHPREVRKDNRVKAATPALALLGACMREVEERP